MREDYCPMSETVQSVDRALTLLTAIADRPDGLSGLARRAKMATSTTGRLLATLEGAGTVSRSIDGTYRIGPAIVAMANAVQALAPPLELAARPHLATLAGTSGEAAGLCVPVGDSIACVAQVDAPKPVQAEDWTGRSWPLHQGGSGIVVLAAAPAARMADYLDRHPNVDGSALLARAAQAVGDGVCWSHGDYRDGLSSVAAPVVDQDGTAVAALYLYGPSYRFPADRGHADRAGELLRHHAEQLSDLLRIGAP